MASKVYPAPDDGEIVPVPGLVSASAEPPGGAPDLEAASNSQVAHEPATLSSPVVERTEVVAINPSLAANGTLIRTQTTAPTAQAMNEQPTHLMTELCKEEETKVKPAVQAAADPHANKRASFGQAINVYNGQGSVLLPVCLCMAEQVGLYSRARQTWCGCVSSKGVAEFLYGGGRWKWENWIVLCYFLFLGLEAVVIWRIMETTDSSQPYDPWVFAIGAYLALAIGALVPVVYAYLKPGDFSR